MLAAHQSETGMYLSELLKNIISIDANNDREITGLCADSRTVAMGDLFVAYCGEQSDGRMFIDQAICRGAAAVICEAGNGIANVAQRTVAGRAVPVFVVPDIQQQLGFIAARFYEDPSATMTMVGITGTNGKTSCSQYLAKGLQALKQRCGIIGTLGYGFADQLKAGTHTTPDPISLQQQLAELKHQGAKTVAMEVSSHGLAQNRIQAVNFDIGVFTNLSRDHLDYHGDMAQYAAAKRRLLMQPTLRAAVINVDDEFGRQLVADFKDKLDIVGYGIDQQHDSVPMVKASAIEFNHKGFSAKLSTPWGEGVLRSHLLGRFNVSNALAVLATLGLMDVPFNEALRCLTKLSTVPGRMQAFGGRDQQPMIVVDYAHTPDALQQALLALREHCKGNLWCVFGAGGDRDRGKRPMMGQVAERYSDQVIITDDNPRTEDPQQIVAQIIEGLLCPWAVEVVHDRHTAIAHAIDCATADDVVLISGKGHESVQIVGTEKIPFNDAEQVRMQLGL